MCGGEFRRRNFGAEDATDLVLCRFVAVGDKNLLRKFVALAADNDSFLSTRAAGGLAVVATSSTDINTIAAATTVDVMIRVFNYVLPRAPARLERPRVIAAAASVVLIGGR